jgi:hypothetical protein
MTNMDLEKYANAPDSMEPEEVLHLFEELLAMPQPSTPDEAILFSEALWEVANRQWHTYTPLNSKTKQVLNNWIVTNWDPSSLKMTKLLLGVIGNIGLSESLQHMKQVIANSKIPFVWRKEIGKDLDRIEENVEDPYFGMKKTKQ